MNEGGQRGLECTGLVVDVDGTSSTEAREQLTGQEVGAGCAEE